MGIHIPERFEEIYGNSAIIQMITDRIVQKTFPQLTLLAGEEGLGKTSVAKLIAMGLNCESAVKPCYNCKSCKEILNNVIRNNRPTVNVKLFAMSGEAKAKDVIDELNTNFIDSGIKVLILDECHRISNADQDALIPLLDNPPKGVYVICCTTDKSSLQKTFLSRAVRYDFGRLKLKEILSLLKQEASYRNLEIKGDGILELIANYSEQKPRAALKVLEAMGESGTVTMKSIKDYICYLETSDVVPLIDSFSGSVLLGVETIEGMKFDINTYNSLVDILQQIVTIAINKRSYRLSAEDNQIFRNVLTHIPTERIIQFFYEVTRIQNFNKASLLSAYLHCHPMLTKLTKPSDEILNIENAERRKAGIDNINNVKQAIVAPPAFEDLLRDGEVLE